MPRGRGQRARGSAVILLRCFSQRLVWRFGRSQTGMRRIAHFCMRRVKSLVHVMSYWIRLEQIRCILYAMPGQRAFVVGPSCLQRSVSNGSCGDVAALKKSSDRHASFAHCCMRCVSSVVCVIEICLWADSQHSLHDAVPWELQGFP